MRYMLQITDNTVRVYSFRDNPRPYTVFEFIEVDDNDPDHDLTIKQYVWNKYGLTRAHYHSCRTCDPREDCTAGCCDLRVNYYRVPDTFTPVKLEGPQQPNFTVPHDWPSNSNPRPSAMFGGGKLTYR
jgi:hypothetical protein